MSHNVSFATLSQGLGEGFVCKYIEQDRGWRRKIFCKNLLVISKTSLLEGF